MQSAALQMLPEEKWTHEGQQVLSDGQKSIIHLAASRNPAGLEQHVAASAT